MNEQSLRRALEALAADYATIDAEQITDLLAAHPAEPAPVVTDEAVQDLHAGVVTQFRRHGQYTLADARAALEAAAPLLGPRALLDRGAALSAMIAHIYEDGDTAVVRQGLPSQEWTLLSLAADAVMELARPMPTQAQLADWLRETFTADSGGTSWDLAAECLLIALNGAES